ncbi:hypothetical protein [Synechococcus sp. WH 5701]|uniref:hypothetical protein n=1 Tax=Synechococcus sp. WH 5701 TaxID=69042 RepID=UPI000069835D|nr:hypothetical protein [Synechococcus sp. WH 5701]EAQ75809.1 hypothetical protein WH5701_03149 [Synechococcus sp. WH 5701]
MKQDRFITMLNDDRAAMRNEQNRCSLGFQTPKVVIALFLKQFISNGERLIDDKHISINMSLHRECQPQRHAAGIAFDRLVNEWSNISKSQDVIKPLFNMSLSQAQARQHSEILFHDR